ncbi:MAG: D-alanyl-D-alanine carboxypeptidase/D-alanyl-D-alanine-endopeptidase [Cyanobacteria bacterium P01_G01_bin.19]
MKPIFVWFRFCALVGVLLVSQTLNAKTVAQENYSVSQSDRSKICSQDLPKAIKEIINRPHLARSRWGMEIQTETGEVLYSLNSHQLFTPASSVKLLTTAAILSFFDGRDRLTTPILASGNAPNLTSLRLKGKGDPTITTQSLEQIANRLQALGVKKIEQLIVEDSYFDAPAINPTWEWLDVHNYFATAANSLILNQNAVTLTILPQEINQPVKFYWSDRLAGRQWQIINRGMTGEKDIPYNIEIDGDLGKPLLAIRGELAVNEPPDIWDMAVVDPANYFLEQWRWQLARAGIEVTRGIVINEAESQELEEELLTISSPAIARMVEEINQKSNNLYAEALAKILAKRLEAEDVIEAINLSLNKLGIGENEYILADASGLSRQNLVSPHTLVKVLDIASKSPKLDRETYRKSLAVAGNSGTLKNRFKDTPVQNNFWGKTGTLTGVGTLSGYLFVPDFSTIKISIMVNNSDLSSKQIRQSIDEIVVVLSHTKNCR